MRYKIEHKIATLSENAVMDGKNPASFSIDDIFFSHWEFNIRDGWREEAWIAESVEEAGNLDKAYNAFLSKLHKIIPRIALISQSYTEYMAQPFLVKREDSDMAFLRYTTDVKGGGLMFMEKEKKALDLLLKNQDIKDAFYYYWNDAVNTVGYPGKLLLMFSAIEALVKDGTGKKDWDKIKAILGEDLTLDLFGTKEESQTGLRHRLVHGEYFSGDDPKKNYLDLVHKKVIGYFNKAVFKENLIEENVVHPQRHPFGNKHGGGYFIKTQGDTPHFSFKEILTDFDQNGLRDLKKYKIVYDEERKTY